MRTATKLHLLTTSIIAGLVAGAGTASAQNADQPNQKATAPTIGDSSTAALPTGDQVPATPADTPNGDVVITGSRIANPNATSVSPVTVVSAQEFKLQGTTRVEDLLNNLPQVLANQGGNLSNGASGIATINLRGLGTQRTLTLINGRRLGPGDPGTSAADINFIPVALIQNVDVLTGGASSTYGSDAVAGVVNFRLNTKFEGLRFDGQYDFFDHNNGNAVAQSVFASPTAGRGFPYPTGHTAQGGQGVLSVTFGAGTADDKGHIVAYAGYRSIAAVTQDSYDYSACSLAEARTTLGFACSGSGTTSPAQFIIGSAQRTINPATGNTFYPYVASRDAFNFAPYNYYQRPDTQITAGAFASYEVSDHFKPYLEFMFMDDHSLAQIAPSGIFGQPFAINCDNPLLSSSQRLEICGATNGAGAGVAGTTGAVSISKRNVEGGGRVNDLRHTDYRAVLGAKGQIDSAFSYDVYGQFSRVIYTENYQNDFSLSRTRQALNVTTVGGQAVCADANARAAGCVPYNIFSLNSVSQAALTYLQTPGFQQGQVDEYVANASVTGNLGKYGLTSPFAENGVGLAFGLEYRKEQLSLLTDAEFSTGDLAGQGGPTKPVSGSFDVKEEFAEINVPLVERKPFFHLLQLDGGYRHSQYSTAGQTNAFKGGVEWEPISPVRLRASYNRAVRAPNIQELFAPTSQSLFAGSDPCAGAAVNGLVNGTPTGPTTAAQQALAYTAAQCARTGVTTAQFGNIVANTANQYNQLSGGNINLTPEVSDTYSAGAVLQPQGFLKGLVVSADYFNIKVNNTIGTVGAALSLTQCVQTGNPAFCSLIQRDPTNGSLFLGTGGQVLNTNQNIGRLQTRGVDIAGSYRFDFERVGLHNLGSLGFDYTGTFLSNFLVSPGSTVSGSTSYDCRGLYGITCGVPRPVYRSNLRVTYNAPSNIQFSINWRHISGVNVDASSSSPFLSPLNTVYPSDQYLPSFNYVDLTVAARVANKFSLRLGVKNIGDVDPPIVGSSNLSGTFGNGNTYPQVYDALGRTLFGGVTVDF